jgi:FkbM family methyltransferase
MLISLHDLVYKYNIQFKGILHVGAHKCEELVHYLHYLPVNKILWVEAIPELVTYCKQLYPNVLIENAIVSDKVEKVNFNVANNGESSSMLDFGLHSQFYPTISFLGYFEGETQLLKDIICNYDIEYNFLNFDIQGAELKALRGMEAYLPKVDYLYIEVNSDYLYKDCSLIDEVDDYLLQFGLIRVETAWCGDAKWGDAFYIRK